MAEATTNTASKSSKLLRKNSIFGVVVIIAIISSLVQNFNGLGNQTIVSWVASDLADYLSEKIGSDAADYTFLWYVLMGTVGLLSYYASAPFRNGLGTTVMFIIIAMMLLFIGKDVIYPMLTGKSFAPSPVVTQQVAPSINPTTATVDRYGYLIGTPVTTKLDDGRTAYLFSAGTEGFKVLIQAGQEFVVMVPEDCRLWHNQGPFFVSTLKPQEYEFDVDNNMVLANMDSYKSKRTVLATFYSVQMGPKGYHNGGTPCS